MTQIVLDGMRHVIERVNKEDFATSLYSRSSNVSTRSPCPRRADAAPRLAPQASAGMPNRIICIHSNPRQLCFEGGEDDGAAGAGRGGRGIKVDMEEAKGDHLLLF